MHVCRGVCFPRCICRQCHDSTFPGTASMLSGIAAGAKASVSRSIMPLDLPGRRHRRHRPAGPSGAIDRNDRIIYLCYDNEAYMNTGIQKSGLTPLGQGPRQRPRRRGFTHGKKNMFESLPLTAFPMPQRQAWEISRSAAQGHKAKEVAGTSYIHVFAPCPTGWVTIRLIRLKFPEGLGKRIVVSRRI